MSQDSSQSASQSESQSSFMDPSERIVLYNPNKSYWSQMWNVLCGNWKLSSNCYDFLNLSLCDRYHISEINSRFETMVIMPIQADKFPDPELDVFNVADKAPVCMVLFHPFDTTDEWFWEPNRIEFHNRTSIALLIGRISAAGWQLDNFVSTKVNYENMMNQIISDSKHAPECAPACSPESAPEQSESDVLQSIVNSDDLIQCLETN